MSTKLSAVAGRLRAPLKPKAHRYPPGPQQDLDDGPREADPEIMACVEAARERLYGPREEGEAGVANGLPETVPAGQPRSRETLHRFVAYVEELRSRRIIQNDDLRSSMTVKAEMGGPVDFSHHEPDEEDLRSYLLGFRKCLAQKEPMFLGRVFNLAYRHITADEIVEALVSTREGWKQALDRGGMNFVINDEQLKPEAVMDLWINGWYFHEDEDKRQRLDALAKVPMTRWLFLNAVVDASNVVFYADHLIGVALRDDHVSKTPVR